MTFRLYDVESEGVALDVDTRDVVVTNGYSSTEVGFSTQYFDGRDPWIGIEVENDAK